MQEIARNDTAIEPASADDPIPTGHNGGPPLDEEHTPEWGHGIGNYFYWKSARRAAWRNPSPGIVAFRIQKAERLGRSRMSSGLQKSSGRARGAPSILEAELAEIHADV